MATLMRAVARDKPRGTRRSRGQAGRGASSTRYAEVARRTKSERKGEAGLHHGGTHGEKRYRAIISGVESKLSVRAARFLAAGP